MDQHPVPQQISSYQFRLVGDMTLKQFFQLAAGFLVALIIYSTGLPFIIKWPIIIVSVIAGVAFAFLPYKERPLSVWMVSFFRAIYSPTEFDWRKYKKTPQFFLPETEAPQVEIKDQTKGQLPQGTAKAQPAKKPSFLSNLENAEKAFISQVSNLLRGEGTAAPPPGQVPSAASQKQKAQQVKTQVVEKKKEPEKQSQDQSNVPQFNPKVVVQKQTDDSGQKQTTPEDVTTSVSPTLSSKGPSKAQEAQFSVDASPPIPPDRENTVVGQVMDSEGKIIEGVILEIKDEGGRPVRALKTNKLGHFIIVTPLQDGTYEIISEKEGYDFDPVRFEAVGEVIPPIAIRANKSTDNQK